MMTSDELARDLRDIDELITVLSASDSDLADADDLHWLLERRRSVSELLAVRRAQRGKKIVSLAMWRYGCATTAEQMAGIA
jgi:predicted nucleic acid-binding Zn ribbon protein